MEIVYSSEDTPLGTGGAIKKALSSISEQNVLVLNGDTFFDFNISSLYNTHQHNSSGITMALKPMKNFDRYGSVGIKNGAVISFEEKGFKEEGLINAGAYLIDCVLMKDFKEFNDTFSFEKDFLEYNITTIRPLAYIQDSYFIDIGIPEDYSKAQLELNDYL
jgi:D-glycero-alpha-D-manno-heptose 1-phosphate guanylyltransferase